MTQLPVTEADLQSYIDGHLPESRRTEIEAYLAARPEETERVLAYRLQTETLRVLFNPVLSEPVPARLTGVPQAKNWMLQRWAASVAIAVAGGAAGWTLHGQMDEPGVSTQAQRSNRIAEGRQVANLARQAAIAHVVYSPDVKRPVEIGADQEEQLVTWLSKRIGSKSLTLYVSTEQAHNKDTGFRFAEEGPVNVFYWIDGKFGYALSAGTNKGELARIASAVHEQLKAPA